MPAPFCTICRELRDTKGRVSCEAFPCGIPKEVYPSGCGPRGVRDFGFMPNRGFEEMARRWEMLDKKDGIASSMLERDLLQIRQKGKGFLSLG
jgi:hypothetical protein